MAPFCVLFIPGLGLKGVATISVLLLSLIKEKRAMLKPCDGSSNFSWKVAKISFITCCWTNLLSARGYTIGKGHYKAHGKAEECTVPYRK